MLTDDASSIARKLIEMEDQAKLKRIAKYINDHLKRGPMEQAVALGRAGYTGLHGDLSKTAALKQARAADRGEIEITPDHSWLVEASTRDGRLWRNGVRLETKEEAEVYIGSHAAFDLKDNGYVTGSAIRCDEIPNCSVTRSRKGGRTTLTYPDGSCVLLNWQPVTDLAASPPSPRVSATVQSPGLASGGRRPSA